MTMLNRNEFIVYGKYNPDVKQMTPDKIKNMIWDIFKSTVRFYYCL